MKNDDAHYGVKGCLSYDPDTGHVRWKRAYRQFKPGDRAGTLRKDGRRDININGYSHPEHRVAWFLYHGRWPDADIDHINGNPSDNRICNLREATRSQNLGNAKVYANNKSGVRGVWFNAKKGVYRASIRVRKKVYVLGEFETLHEAAEAYRKAALGGFGEFARRDLGPEPSVFHARNPNIMPLFRVFTLSGPLCLRTHSK